MIADDIQIHQDFDPEGEKGGYKFKTVVEPFVVNQRCSMTIDSAADFASLEKRIAASFGLPPEQMASKGELAGRCPDMVIVDDLEDGVCKPGTEAHAKAMQDFAEAFSGCVDTPVRLAHHGTVTGQFSGKGPDMQTKKKVPIDGRKLNGLKMAMRVAIRRSLDEVVREAAADYVAQGIEPNQIRTAELDIQIDTPEEAKKRWFGQLKDDTLRRTGRPPHANGFDVEFAEQLFLDNVTVSSAFNRLRRRATKKRRS